MQHDKAIQAMRNVSATTELVKAYASSDSANATCAMLDALIDSYKLDLMHVTPEGLTRLQALIQQTDAIRGVVSGERQGLPKI